MAKIAQIEEGEENKMDYKKSMDMSGAAELFQWQTKGWTLYLNRCPSNPISIEYARQNAVFEGACYMPDFEIDPETGEKRLNYDLIITEENRIRKKLNRINDENRGIRSS